MKHTEKRPAGRQGAALSLFNWLQALIAALVGISLIFTFVGRLTPVDGISMEPTLVHGDLMLIQTLGYVPRQGDVVVLTKAFDAADGPIVKRVIATGGQTVEIDYEDRMVYVDGLPLDEPYLKTAMVPPHYENLTSVQVPEGSIFVMGDNRNASGDSRDVTLGPVDVRYVIGGARFVLFPFRDFGAIR